MIEGLPAHISPIFMITTFATVVIFLYAVRRSGTESWPSKLIVFLIPFWMILTAISAIGGFYLETNTVPPRIFLFGVGPALLLIFVYFVFARESFIASLPLGVLTLIHTIRIPVELVLSWLFAAGAVPEIMTFHGSNFDILSGLTAPVVYLLAFRHGRTNRPLLIAWNVLALILVLNIVTIAILCLQTPFQQFAFDQPNRAVLYFPFVWLPAVVVPIVLFCHIAALWKLLGDRTG
jgi:hypothetical protein